MLWNLNQGADTYFPGIGEGNVMVDVYIACGGPGRAVEGRVPCSRCGSARGILDDIGTVALEDDFAGVAGAGDGCQLDGLVICSRVYIVPGFHVIRFTQNSVAMEVFSTRDICLPALCDPVRKQVP